MTHSAGNEQTLRTRVADMLAENDACGTGPLSRQEYLEDADALISLLRGTVAAREHLVVLLDALYAVATHETNEYCDRECADWMHGRAREAMRIFFGTEDWKWADVERARTEMRS